MHPSGPATSLAMQNRDTTPHHHTRDAAKNNLRTPDNTASHGPRPARRPISCTFSDSCVCAASSFQVAKRNKTSLNPPHRQARFILVCLADCLAGTNLSACTKVQWCSGKLWCRRPGIQPRVSRLIKNTDPNTVPLPVESLIICHGT